MFVLIEVDRDVRCEALRYSSKILIVIQGLVDHDVKEHAEARGQVG